jgi:hypothetical protein
LKQRGKYRLWTVPAAAPRYLCVPPHPEVTH